jgi:hypothetical protein
VEGDVGGLACTVAADVERNLGGRRSCSGLSPAMQVVGGGGGVSGAAKDSKMPLGWWNAARNRRVWEGREREVSRMGRCRGTSQLVESVDR